MGNAWILEEKRDLLNERFDIAKKVLFKLIENGIARGGDVEDFEDYVGTGLSVLTEAFVDKATNATNVIAFEDSKIKIRFDIWLKKHPEELRYVSHFVSWGEED